MGITGRSQVPLLDCRAWRDGRALAGFSWDGDTLIFDHEPGGGVQAECEATDDAVKKSYFFHDSNTGAKLGSFLLPRNQSSSENCTLRNYNVVPLRDGDDVLVHASYQAGSGSWTSTT